MSTACPRHRIVCALTALSLLLPLSAHAASPGTAQAIAAKAPTPHTLQSNNQVRTSLPFQDTQDFEDARRGFIAADERVTIKNAEGRVVWDLEQYKSFIANAEEAPDSVNPSLWRNARLCLVNGLFKVTDRIYQVRGYDISNITFVQGDTGWIVFDPLISTETARAALELLHKHVDPRPVVAVVYSHSHVDHYGGVRGVVDEADVRSGKVQILAPEHFTKHAVSENVMAGNAMSRRAIYMYGSLLPRNARGGVNGGLGMTVSSGQVGFIPPTREITRTGEEVVIDGVRMVFQMTPGTEAPAEMNTWFPQFSALWMAENTCNTMHNILTLRGALVRDALGWAGYLQESIELWGAQAQVKFQAHHWPRWGSANIQRDLTLQRDMYKYMHDQTVRLMNMGYTGEEIAEIIKMPAELSSFWANRDYYGTLRHNSRAIYQRYMGWYDGHPASLNKLPPQMAATRYVEFMGGEAETLRKARATYEQGDYRWTAEVLKHVVFANEKNTAARELLADTLEQMGYQAESGPWRSIYLQGASELRHGLPKTPHTKTGSSDTLSAMSPAMIFDYLAVRLNPEKVAGKRYVIHFTFPDIKESYAVSVENSVLHSRLRPAGAGDGAGSPGATDGPDAPNTPVTPDKAAVSLTLDKSTLIALGMGGLSLAEAQAQGKLTVQGKLEVFTDLLASLDAFDPWFPIVTP